MQPAKHSLYSYWHYNILHSQTFGCEPDSQFKMYHIPHKMFQLCLFKRGCVQNLPKYLNQTIKDAQEHCSSRLALLLYYYRRQNDSKEYNCTVELNVSSSPRTYELEYFVGDLQFHLRY